jgi:hypothetical protein
MSLSPVLKPDQDEAAETSVQQQHESTWNVEEPDLVNAKFFLTTVKIENQGLPVTPVFLVL